MNDKQASIMSTGFGTIALVVAIIEAWAGWSVALWAWVALAGVFFGVAVHIQRSSKMEPVPVMAERKQSADPGQNLKDLYESISIAVDNANDAKDALLQFCATQGYRALQQGSSYFVQDLRTGKVYRANFPSFQS